MKLQSNKIICVDVKEILSAFPANCIDLIVTSPPYADCRKKSYGSIHLINMLNGSYPLKI